jgi:hypothetical protein
MAELYFVARSVPLITDSVSVSRCGSGSPRIPVKGRVGRQQQREWPPKGSEGCRWSMLQFDQRTVGVKMRLLAKDPWGPSASGFISSDKLSQEAPLIRQRGAQTTGRSICESAHPRAE